MLLTRLMDYKDQVGEDLPPPEHKKNQIDWVVDLDETGKYLGFINSGDVDSSLEDYVPYRRRSGRKPPPYLLVDKPSYVLNLDIDGKGDEKVQVRHEMFKELLSEALDQTESSSLKAILSFLDSLPEKEIGAREDEMNSGDLVTFRVDQEWVYREPDIQDFWVQKLSSGRDEKSDKIAECVICGKEKPVAKTHPIELNVGPNRTQLISANANSFLSFGLEQSEIAPTCNLCALDYGRTFRHLLNSADNSYQLSGSVFVFWVIGASEFNPFEMLHDPQPQEVERFLKSPFRDEDPVVPGGASRDDRFVLFMVTANKSRLVVRNHLEMTLEQLVDNVRDFFERQEIIQGDGSPHKPMGLYSLLGGMVRDLQDLPPDYLNQLVETALLGSPLPASILSKTIKRIKAEPDYRVTRPRAALLKMTLNQSREEENALTRELDKENKEPAYLCGRLFALIERIQASALPGIDSSLGDRFYGTASTAPASVFGTLIRKAQTAYLPKLRKNKEGAFHALSQKLEGLLDGLDDFPNTLNMKQQGLFGLGYYQEKAESRRQAKEAMEERDKTEASS